MFNGGAVAERFFWGKGGGAAPPSRMVKFRELRIRSSRGIEDDFP